MLCLGMEAYFMAVCRICNTVDESLPEDWTNWECWQCFLEGLVTYTDALNSKVNDAIVADLQLKRDKLNMALVDKQMDLVLAKAEAANE